MRQDYEKRKFFEAASMVILLGTFVSGKTLPARRIVNAVGELWDEIELQVPRNTENKDVP